MGGKDGQHKVRKHFLKRELLTREQLEGRHVSKRLDTKALDSIGCGEVTGWPSWAFLLGRS